MSFAEALGGYMDSFGIKASSLAEASGLSGATISRFRNGKRTPSHDDGTVERIAAAIASLSGEAASKEEVCKTLSEGIEGETVDRDKVVGNLNVLIEALDLNAADLARSIGYDPSHLSKIRSGTRRPGKGAEFCESVASYVSRQLTERNVGAVARLIGCETGLLLAGADSKKVLFEWLSSGVPRRENAVRHFLCQLDEFDLNEYLQAASFDSAKVPDPVFQPPRSKDFYGIEGFREAELAWGRATVMSKSMDDVFMYSDMPMEEEAQDEDFAKQWMMGIAAILKKGLRINVIHDLDRPLEEMMLGLEGWIPLYMTGRVSPYYLKGYKPGVFNRFLRVSGAAALSGDSVAGAHANGRYHLGTSKDELSFFGQYSRDLLAKASPLMEIYSAGEEDAYKLRLERALENGQGLHALELGDGAFKNMVLESAEGECVVITKTNDPVMHFVIRHPKLMHSIENLSVPIVG